ncbi:MAG: tol-pal system protein YbgF [Candidatus Symbiobacter sp.]|nr:tol-pal system protein YbgF [Candidatus Symbiobacter sp.]
MNKYLKKLMIHWLILGGALGWSAELFALDNGKLVANNNPGDNSALLIQYDDRLSTLEKNIRELRGQIEGLTNLKQNLQKNLDRIYDKLDKIEERVKKIDHLDDLDSQMNGMEERVLLLEKISQKFYESLNGITERMVGIEEFVNNTQAATNKGKNDKAANAKNPQDAADKANKTPLKLSDLLNEGNNKPAKTNNNESAIPPAKAKKPKDEGSPPRENNSDTAATNPVVLKTSPDELKKLYQASIDALNQGEYGRAESGFKKVIAKYPDYTVTPNSYYWLGEVYFLKNDWGKAAKQFFAAYQKYPNASKAADSLYRLGLTLHELNKYDESCSALARVGVEFPKASKFIRQGAIDAMSRFNCNP